MAPATRLHATTTLIQCIYRRPCCGSDVRACYRRVPFVLEDRKAYMGEGLRFGVADGSALGSDLSKRRPRQSSMKRIGLYFEFAETGRALLRRRLQFAARLVVYAEARGI